MKQSQGNVRGKGRAGRVTPQPEGQADEQAERMRQTAQAKPQGCQSHLPGRGRVKVST